MSLKPIVKWLGGKRKEIKKFEHRFPSFVTNGEPYTYVEPFIGGGALFFHLENKNSIINDFEGELTNFYKVLASQNSIFLSELDRLSKITGKEELKKVYFEYRNKDQNKGLASLSNVENAIRFFVVNQLSFSGLRRYNAAGENNINFGYYSTFNSSIIHSDRHINLLKSTDIRTGDFEQVMLDNDKENTFIFLDPPYTRVYKKYSANNSFGEPEHERLKKTMDAMKKAKVMLIIDKSDFTEKLHKDCIKESYVLRYSLVLEGGFNPSSEHLLITNY